MLIASRTVFGTAVKTLFGMEIDQIQMSHFVYILKSAGGYRNLMLTIGNDFKLNQQVQGEHNRTRSKKEHT